MTIKTKTIKNPREFPYQKYTSKIGNYKFEANLFEGYGGQLLAYIKKDMIICREDAKLDDWIDGAREKSAFYSYLFDFLMEVKDRHNNKD